MLPANRKHEMDIINLKKKKKEIEKTIETTMLGRDVWVSLKKKMKATNIDI